MEIEIKELMDNNEMLSHIFLGCIPREQLLKIKDEYIDDIDWKTESTKIPVEMKIGGVDVNPKQFFDTWKDQMNIMISDKAKALSIEKLGSSTIRNMINKLHEYQDIMEIWEDEINWDIKNPLTD